MTETEKQINLNSGFKLYGGAPHTIVETSREALSEVPEKNRSGNLFTTSRRN